MALEYGYREWMALEDETMCEIAGMVTSEPRGCKRKADVMTVVGTKKLKKGASELDFLDFKTNFDECSGQHCEKNHVLENTRDCYSDFQDSELGLDELFGQRRRHDVDALFGQTRGKDQVLKFSNDCESVLDELFGQPRREIEHVSETSDESEEQDCSDSELFGQHRGDYEGKIHVIEISDDCHDKDDPNSSHSERFELGCIDNEGKNHIIEISDDDDEQNVPDFESDSDEPFGRQFTPKVNDFVLEFCEDNFSDESHLPVFEVPATLQ